MPHQNSPVDQGELPNEGPLSQPRRTSLSLAAEKGVESQVRLLLADGADATLKDMDGRTPLSYAASHGHAPIVELLLSQEGVEPDSRDKHGKSPLSWAAQCGHENIVKILLANDKVDPHWHNEFGVGPLVFSVGGGNESIVKLLLTKGVDPGRQLGALLIMAEENGHLGIFEALKKSVVPTNISSRPASHLIIYTLALSYTLFVSYPPPLSWAAARRDERVVKMLLNIGKVDVVSKDKNRWTPPSWAAAKENWVVIICMF